MFVYIKHIINVAIEIAEKQMCDELCDKCGAENIGNKLSYLA